MAQIELLELVGRAPDRPDNVVVVGDDDQSIYRFRGASYAAFAEFDRRFARRRARPDGRRPAPPPRLRLEENFRSVEQVLDGRQPADRAQPTRFEPDKRLVATRGPGAHVEVDRRAPSPEDEAAAIVDAIKSELSPGEGAGRPRWRDSRSCTASTSTARRSSPGCATRASRTRSSAGCPCSPRRRSATSSRACGRSPTRTQDVALVRMMTAGPWRLDALEILQSRGWPSSTGAHHRRHPEVVETGEVDVDEWTTAGTDADRATEGGATSRRAAAWRSSRRPTHRRRGATATRNPSASTSRRYPGEAPPPPRDPQRAARRDLARRPATRSSSGTSSGPGSVLDLVARRHPRGEADGREHRELHALRRGLAAEHPKGTLGGFVDYLDAYQSAGGELPTSVELSDDVEGVRLMTLYQAKGLEFPNVFVPQLLQDEWPAREYGCGLFPKELLRRPFRRATSTPRRSAGSCTSP